MNIVQVKNILAENGFKLERLYVASSTDFSVLHSNACKDFLKHSLSLHEFYCDMKRFEALNVGDIAFVIYGGNLLDGFPTSVRIDDDGITKIIDAFSWSGVETVLAFELTHFKKHPTLEMPSVPAGRIYKLVK